MENIVSARRLRKSMLREMDGKTFDFGGEVALNLDKHYTRNKNEEAYSSFYDSDSEEGKHKIKINGKTKFMLKCFISVIIVFTCLLCKLVFPDKILSLPFVKTIADEYQRDYTKADILTKIEKISSSIYHNFQYIIPESLANTLKGTYFQTVKPKVENFKLKESTSKYFFSKAASNTINQDLSSKAEEKTEETKTGETLNGIGGGEPIEQAIKTPEESSAVSMMQDDLGKIVSKNINMIKPISGVITSNYGARDQIFDGVNAYHTGLDIASNTGTQIHSVTTGKVVKVQQMDKYYGNNVTIETDGVMFKYAHMEEIKVKLNDEIKQNDIVGLVGSTGMSTGPHLHLEISVDGRTVDPRQLISY